MVNTKPILKRLWRDTCTITEYQEYQGDDKSTEFKEVVVLENEPCKLSFKLDYPVIQTDTTANITQQVKLFIDNAVKVRAGSKITVQRENEMFNYKQSGEPAFFSSHQEIILVPFRGWA